MTIQALNNDDFSLMYQAAQRLEQYTDLQAQTGMSRDHAQWLKTTAAMFDRGQRPFWPVVHNAPGLLPGLMDAFIAAESELPKKRDVLSLLLGWRASQLQADRKATTLARRARRFSPKIKQPTVFSRTLKDMVTVPQGDVLWTHCDGRFPRFETSLRHQGQYPYKLLLTTNSLLNTLWVEVSPGVDHSEKYAGWERELDIRVDGERIDVSTVGPDVPRVVQGFVVASSLPARVLTISSFGCFHSALIVHSARMLFH